MRLGFDLDGTVADLQSALALEARRLFPGIDPASLPRSVSPEATSTPNTEAADDPQMSIGALTARQQRELWKAVCARPNFWETLGEIEPGSLERLFHLVRARRWELIFLTSRPETAGDTAQVQSYRWLVAHGFLSPSIFVVHGSRGKIAAALQLDVLVDDRPENCLDIAIDSNARPILVWRGDEAHVPASARDHGIGPVGSVAECLDILEALDEPEPNGPGFIERLKRLLGLKPRTKPPGTSQLSTATPPGSRTGAVP